jgi:hypothetical protein
VPVEFDHDAATAVEDDEVRSVGAVALHTRLDREHKVRLLQDVVDGRLDGRQLVQPAGDQRHAGGGRLRLR